MQNDPRYYGGQGSHYYDGGASNYYDAGSYYPYNPPTSYGGGGAGGGGFFDYDYGGYGTSAPPVAPSFGTNGVELQASDNCPNNYLIFDHTDNRSRIMYNPAFGQGFGNYPHPHPGGFHQVPEPPAAAVAPPPVQHHQEDYRTAWRDDSRGKSSLKEDDSEDIDALLSLEDDEDNDEDDVVSTGRTPSCKYRCSNSPDSTCSTGGSKSVSHQHYADDSAGSSPVGPGKKKKKDRMKKMVKVLRGIVPGGQQMDTPAVLDEAVKYLKSLKVEARKLGIRS